MKRKTGKEISDEIAALRALVPVGPFKEKTRAHIANAIDELLTPFDDTSGEWEELSEAERDTRMQVRAWADGDNQDAYSDRKGWGSLVQ